MSAVIGVLTAGGDCPGLNAAIRAVVTRATERHEAEVVGILNGWEGLMQGRTRPLDRDSVRGILARGGTILGTSRMDPYVHGDGYDSIRMTIERNGIDSARTKVILQNIRVFAIDQTVQRSPDGGRLCLPASK